jgi:cation transporter-like permease
MSAGFILVSKKHCYAKEVTTGNLKSMRSIHTNTILHSGHGKKPTHTMQKQKKLCYKHILQFNIHV